MYRPTAEELTYWFPPRAVIPSGAITVASPLAFVRISRSNSWNSDSSKIPSRASSLGPDPPNPGR